MNYKIKVGSEAESKEAQELFVALGGEVRLDDHVGIVCLTEGKIYTDDIKFYDAYGDCKELTIPQLRDMVVLKRNDPKDANVEDRSHHDLYLSIDKKLYYFDHGNNNWLLSKVSGIDSFYKVLKPVEKPMKEFLNKLEDGTYKLVLLDSVADGVEGLIEVPDGSDIAFQAFSNSPVVFKRSECGYSNAVIVWQRETLNDKVASAEVARQEFIGAPFSDLPEVNFEAVDDFVESNVEQDNVNQPSHYCSHPSGIECIEITRHHDFTIGNAIKYLWRAGLKDSADEIQDLEKASWYIQDKINQLKKLNDNP